MILAYIGRARARAAAVRISDCRGPRCSPLLAGVTVVSIEQAVAAPFATRQLADLGARVIKIERPDGGDFARSYDRTVGGLSSYFVWLNRSKESLTLDLKQPAAQPVLARLLERADVFVQNLAPGAADRLGAAAADLRARHPRLITCAVSGYGSAGPYADKKAYDMLIQAEAGLVSITGTPEAPSRVGISVADIAAGMYAYSGILTALLARATTGAGTAIEVSLFDALGEWMGAPAYYTAYGGVRAGAQRRRARDDRAVRALRERRTTSRSTWRFRTPASGRASASTCSAQPELADDPRFATNAARVQHRADAARAHRRRLRAICRRPRSSIAWRRAGIAYARRNSVDEFLEHPQLVERDRWRTIGSPVGPLRALLPPVRMDGVDPVMGDVPSLGQHSQPILEELGFDAGHDRGLAEGADDLMAIKQGWTGRVFEDFEVGDVYEHPLGRTVIAADNIWFTCLTMNTNPIHFDAEYASADGVQAAAGQLVLHARAGDRAVGHRPHGERASPISDGTRSGCRTRCSKGTPSARRAKCSRRANRNHAPTSASSA